MLTDDQAVPALREAVQVSPDNAPLRQHLANTLLNVGRPDEAEREFRLVLRLVPNDGRVKLGLADAFAGQGKDGEALVTVEALLREADAPPRAYLLHARLLLRAGEATRAAHQYHRALALDPSLADEELAARLGVGSFTDASRPVGQERAAHPEHLAAVHDGVERPTVTFADVGGMEALKDEIRLKIVHPLAHPELYRAYGKPVGGGILLYGPPGCGKTHLARATAGEVRAGFIAVGISDVLDMWIGSSEKNLHAVFDQARRTAPCVLFFDEVDALGARRSDLRQGGARQLINQFLAELDGVDTSNDGVLVLAATNAPWHLDPACRRPGRFDRVLFVPPPDAPARAAILRLLCRGKPVTDIDFDHLTRKSERFSGADLQAAVDVAVERKLRDAIATGVPKPLTTKDLATAIAARRPTTTEWFATARNHALYANEGGAYDDVLEHLKLGRP